MKRIITIFTATLLTISLAAQTSIIPKPNKVEMGEGFFQLNENSVVFSNEKSSSNIEYLRNKLVKATNFPFKVTESITSANCISIDYSKDYNIVNEGYKLTVTTSGITIQASS